ncbi:MAG: hypothetical protein L0J69_00260 [Yaniella sp.]|nr:hypothetical protein [Yaniella sp.]
MALKLLSHAAMSDEFARLVSTVSGKRGMFDIVMFDPFSQEARRRSVLYEGGLESPNELMPTFWTFGVTARFLSPFWRGPERGVVERIAPPVKPLITADPGSPVNRWDDPGFGDSTAYEPWFVVDAGLEKQGTGAEHGRFVAGHRVAVNPGETVSVSAGVSYVDGPNVGDIQVRVRAYDSDGALVSGSEQTVISESYGGTYTGTYVVPETGVEIELGFYTASDVHANTRARIDNLDVKRGIQYLARYEWEGEPHNSPSVKRVGDEVVARNLGDNPTTSGTTGWGTSNTANWAIERVALDDHPDGLKQGYRSQAVLDGNHLDNVLSMYDIGGTRLPAEVSGHAYGVWVKVNVPSTALRRPGSPPITPDTWTYLTAFRDSYLTIVQIQVNNPDDIGAAEAFITGANIATADTEEAALAQVETYFDGDTPDVVDEGSREGSYSFPFFPVFLADSTVQGEHDLTVEGDAPVWPVWEIQGPGRDVEIIGPDGSRLFVEGEVTTPIRIVTEPGKRSIRDASGLIWERMKPGDDQFFPLEPGEQTVKMTMVGGTPESTIKAVYSENWKTPRGTAQGIIRGDVV